jgi:cobalamin biosynthesis protein CobT
MNQTLSSEKQNDAGTNENISNEESDKDNSIDSSSNIHENDDDTEDNRENEMTKTSDKKTKKILSMISIQYHSYTIFVDIHTHTHFLC